MYVWGTSHASSTIFYGVFLDTDVVFFFWWSPPQCNQSMYMKKFSIGSSVSQAFVGRRCLFTVVLLRSHRLRVWPVPRRGKGARFFHGVLRLGPKAECVVVYIFSRIRVRTQGLWLLPSIAYKNVRSFVPPVCRKCEWVPYIITRSNMFSIFFLYFLIHVRSPAYSL